MASEYAFICYTALVAGWVIRGRFVCCSALGHRDLPVAIVIAKTGNLAAWIGCAEEIAYRVIGELGPGFVRYEAALASYPLAAK